MIIIITAITYDNNLIISIVIVTITYYVIHIYYDE